jgi:hypothetical protein
VSCPTGIRATCTLVGRTNPAISSLQPGDRHRA